MAALPLIGRRLKHWRKVRGWSQLDLAEAAGISARHLGFIEVGRSRPGREVVLRLGEGLDLPLRERNALLEAAGWLPAYEALDLDDALQAPVRAMLRLMLDKQEPFPALVVDRWWRFVDANQAALRMFPQLTQLPPEGLVEAFYGPGPMRDLIVNWPEVAWGGVDRLRREAAEAGFPEQLTSLVATAESWLQGVPRPDPTSALSPVACPIFRFGDQEVRTMTAVANFGTAQDVTMQELRIELIYPADEASKRFFEALAMAADSSVEG